MAFTVRGFFPLSVALFCILSFSLFILPASAIPTANVNIPVANWAIHRQGSHIPVVAGHGVLAKRICYGDCRAVQAANATTPENASPSPGVPAAETPLPAASVAASSLLSAEASESVVAPASASPLSAVSSSPIPSSFLSTFPSAQPSPSSSTSEEAQNSETTSGARSASRVTLLPLALLVGSTVLYVL